MRRYTIRPVVIVAALTATMIVLMHFVAESRKSAKRLGTKNSFKLIALALHNASDVYKRLPDPIRRAGNADSPLGLRSEPNAEQLYSWRFAIIPYIASYKMDAAFGHSWRDPLNARWRTVPQPYAYDGWGDGVADRRDPNTIPTETSAFAICGPGTAFGDGDTELPRSLEDIDEDTILVVEVRNSGIHWMEPGDFDIRTMPRAINDPDGRGISSAHDSGFHVVFADATVWYLRNDTPFEELAKFFTVDGAKANDRDTVLRPYLLD